MIEVSDVLEVYFFVSAHILFFKLGNALLVHEGINTSTIRQVPGCLLIDRAIVFYAWILFSASVLVVCPQEAR